VFFRCHNIEFGPITLKLDILRMYIHEIAMAIMAIALVLTLAEYVFVVLLLNSQFRSNVLEKCDSGCLDF